MAPQREWFEKDYYAVLGVPHGRDRQGRRARVPEARQAVPPRRERGRQGRPRSASRRCRPRTTCSATPRSARSTTRSAQMVASGVGPGGFGGVGPGGFGGGADVPLRRRRRHGRPLGDLLGGLFGGPRPARPAARGPQRPAARPGPRDRAAPRLPRRRARRHHHGEHHADAPCSVCGGSGRRAGHVPETCARRAAAPARSRSTRAVLVLAGVPDVRRARAGRHGPVPDVQRPRRRGAAARGEGAHPGRCRRRAAHPREGPRRAPGATAARRATSTSSCTCAPHPMFGRSGERPHGAACRSRSPRPRSAPR